jgi:hypothetical protein
MSCDTLINNNVWKPQLLMFVLLQNGRQQPQELGLNRSTR